ncbi:bile acid:sodium symporter family protein [Corynebacterium testudinoris]|uniref:Putative Na+-dependent transporter n=1 Tax=Corynebacterium testudinoris TaxID=136857 RepID=A0A0G3H5U5_9CORY|nr:bile acid:sodium symporter family protein [Corynebacterium testudinoris]AKK08739.1 putative Na+-dependent transporter [Corynebacterium testudinoris]MBX8994823.1 bile acid:sodium symporter family protein [Corynebacterium testudinoris]
MTTFADSHRTTTDGTTVEDRSATLAVLVFPVAILIGAAIAFFNPSMMEPFGPHVSTMLMIIMFCMGLTLTMPDLSTIARRPWPIFIGVACQYIIMPLSAVAAAWMLGFSPELTVGLIMLGSVPGGTASNVIAYLAKGDVALSVAMTSVSTLISPIVTPLLMLWLAGQSTEVDAMGMTISLLKTVLIPVSAGLLIRLFAGKLVDKILPILPWLSIIVIVLVLMTVVARSASVLITVGLIAVAGVAIQNFIGFLAGYLLPKVLKQDVASCRTTSIEVATQNSALASGLAGQFFSPEAAIPGAIATVWSNITGAIFAAFCRRNDARKAKQTV